ncbi:MAG: ABC transporter substrate-binding protein [Sphingobium sp.]
MTVSTKRAFLRGLACAGLAPLVAPTLLAAQPSARPVRAPKKFRMILNANFSSPQGWLLLALDRGYLAAEGIELELTTGEGAFKAAPRMAAEGYDLGYGDVNSLIEVVAKGHGETGVGVFMMHNSTPSAICVKSDGPIKTLADLNGKTITGHDRDVALKTFPAFCKKTGVDLASVKSPIFGGGMTDQVKAMLAPGGVDGLFGYVSTIRSAIVAGGLDLDAVRFIKYIDHVPDLYGSSVMASRRMMQEEPEALAAIIRAFNRGVRDEAANRDAVLDAVLKRDPKMNRASEKIRLDTTLELEMANPEGKRLGIGDVDDARLTRAVALVCETNGMPRTPALKDVFDRRFLPPVSERVTTLAS